MQPISPRSTLPQFIDSTSQSLSGAGSVSSSASSQATGRNVAAGLQQSAALAGSNVKLGNVSALDAKKQEELNRDLIAAASCGDAEAVQRLLDMSADMNAKGIVGTTPLMQAAKSGHVAVVQLLLDKDTDVNAKETVGWTPLMYAVRSGHVAVVQLLLNKDTDVNAKNCLGWTPLMQAIYMGHTAIVKLLLDEGADVNVQSNTFMTPLMCAANRDHVDAIKLLVEAGANLDHGDDMALRVAAKKGRADVVELLIKKGVVVTGKAAAGESALRAAIEHGHANVVQLLIDRGVEVKDKEDQLADAAKRGHTEVVRVLIDAFKKAGVSVNSPSVETALNHVAEGGHLEILQMLIKAGLDVPKSSMKVPAFMAAVQARRIPVARLFLANGVNIQDVGEPALKRAAAAGQVDMLQFLIDVLAKAGVEVKGSIGQAALLSARENKQTKTVELLESIVGSSSTTGPVWIPTKCSALIEQALEATRLGNLEAAAKCILALSLKEQRNDVEGRCMEILAASGLGASKRMGKLMELLRKDPICQDPESVVPPTAELDVPWRVQARSTAATLAAVEKDGLVYTQEQRNQGCDLPKEVRAQFITSFLRDFVAAAGSMPSLTANPSELDILKQQLSNTQEAFANKTFG